MFEPGGTVNRLMLAVGSCSRQCGYILRGLTSGRCPECGLAFAPHVAAIANS